MMKKVILILLVATLACSALLSACANPIEQIDPNLNAVPYDYPVKPGTEEWNSLSLDERMTLSSVDESLVKTMTTEAVLVTTLNYPFIVNVFAYGKPGEGIDVVKEYCSPLAELLERDDALLVISAYLDETEDSESVAYIVADNLREYMETSASA